jgi:CheY-like chemotaxis protein
MGIALERADSSRRYELHRRGQRRQLRGRPDGDWDVILCDFNLPRFSPYAALQILVTRPQQRAADRAHARDRRGSGRCTCCAAAPRTT